MIVYASLGTSEYHISIYTLERSQSKVKINDEFMLYLKSKDGGFDGKWMEPNVVGYKNVSDDERKKTQKRQGIGESYTIAEDEKL